MNWQTWLLWPDYPLWSILALLLPLWSVLYAAREPAHRLVRVLVRSIHLALRIASRWFTFNADELRERNRAVLIAHGRDELGQRISRELERIDNVVRRDLHGYPALQRKLLEQVRSLEEDHKRHAEPPPEAPEWTKVMIAITKAKPSADATVARIIADLQQTVSDAHAAAQRDYGRAFASRHRALEGLLPSLHTLQRTLSSLDQNIAELRWRAGEIDAQVARFDEMHRRSVKAERALTVSAAIQFGLSLLVLLGAIGGMVLNFSLIALPLAEIVDNSRYIGNVPVSDIAAAAIIALEAIMGLLLTEALRLTHVIPRVSYLSDRARRRLVVAAIVFLVMFAGLELTLALIHNQLEGLDPLVNSSLLVPKSEVVMVNAWLGVLLPFALAFVAIPIESLLYALRSVSGMVLVLTLRGIAFLLHFLGAVVRVSGAITLRLYDVVIFPALALERLLRPHLAPEAETEEPEPARGKH